MTNPWTASGMRDAFQTYFFSAPPATVKPPTPASTTTTSMGMSIATPWENS